VSVVLRRGVIKGVMTVMARNHSRSAQHDRDSSIDRRQHETRGDECAQK
jgi:hypothetical protein